MRWMADQIAALVPGTTWNFVQDTFTDCGGDYVWTDAKEAYFLIGFSGSIPGEKWDQAVQIVKDGTSRFSATNLVVAKNNSVDHDVSISEVRRRRLQALRSEGRGVHRTFGLSDVTLWRPVCSHGEKSGQMSLRAHTRR
jgi:hypothetical protein